MKITSVGSSARNTLPAGWSTLFGIDELLALQPRLAALAERCGQAGAMDSLDYFLTVPHLGLQQPARSARMPNLLSMWRSKLPRLLLRNGPAGLDAAVLLLEYHPCGVPTGLFIPMDGDGHRTIVAPAGERAAVALQAGEFLIGCGANLALITCAELADPPYPAPAGLTSDSAADFRDAPRLIATQSRSVFHTLPLASTYDATLETMGRHTRRNLRACHRRAVRELGASYRPHAEISLPEFLKLNRASMYAVPDWVACWRYQSARSIDGGIFAGLQAADGRWLSIIGGHARSDIARLDWQANFTGFGSLSLVTTMRAFFIGSQVDRGMRWLRFEGGTPHSMSSAFLKEDVRDLVFARNALSPRALRRLAGAISKTGPLRNVLAADSLVWR